MGDPVGYMERSRAYYAAQGFETPYRWAHFDEVPFTTPAKPLAEATLVAITTAALYDRTRDDPREVASFESAHPPDRLYAGDLSWDRNATHMEDREAFMPLAALRDWVESGKLGGLTPRFHCAPTEYSIRRTLTQDAPELLARARADGADIALLIPI